MFLRNFEKGVRNFEKGVRKARERCCKTVRRMTSPQFMYQLILEGQAVLCSSRAVSVVKP